MDIEPNQISSRLEKDIMSFGLTSGEGPWIATIERVKPNCNN
jgi:hypothetical protein